MNGMYFAFLKYCRNKGIVNFFCKNFQKIFFVKIVKLSCHHDPPPITAPASKGQNLPVPSRPLSRGYTAIIHRALCDITVLKLKIN